MTWTYEHTDGGVIIRDHNGTQISTLENNGRGLVLPDDVLAVMNGEFDAALSSGNTSRALAIVGDGGFGQIEEYSSGQ